MNLYSDDLATALCDMLASGDFSLRSACKVLGVSPATVFTWRDGRNGAPADFGERYARARAMGYELMGEDVLEISDTTQEGEEVTLKPDGMEVKRGDMLGHRKLRTDSRKWYLSKVLPKVYGDKLGLEHSGSVEQVVRVRDFTGRKQQQQEGNDAPDA